MMPETKSAWARLNRNFGRMMQQKALGWALWWTPNENLETLDAFFGASRRHGARSAARR